MSIISIFSRLFKDRLLEQYEHRIYNLHPSLLPAFPGLNSLDRSMNSGVRLVGSTIHVVDRSLDGGPIVSQSIVVNDPGSCEMTKHKVFTGQCKMLIQLVNYINNKRLKMRNGKMDIQDAMFDDLQFIPALDDLDALSLEIPFPGLSFFKEAKTVKET